jgi:hypothetical protein
MRYRVSNPVRVLKQLSLSSNFQLLTFHCVQ